MPFLCSFFKQERERILLQLEARTNGKGHGVISFANLAKTVAARWKLLNDEEREPYEELAAADRERYRAEKKAWMKRQRCKKATPKSVPAKRAKSDDWQVPLPAQLSLKDACFQAAMAPLSCDTNKAVVQTGLAPSAMLPQVYCDPTLPELGWRPLSPLHFAIQPPPEPSHQPEPVVHPLHIGSPMDTVVAEVMRSDEDLFSRLFLPFE